MASLSSPFVLNNILIARTVSIKVASSFSVNLSCKISKHGCEEV
jgi:hypothetical protein